MAGKFDIIIVGGGHNGLACGAYLAKAGLSVIVLEKRELVGGGVMTEGLTLPGFKHNTHSAMHEWIFTGPVYNDLELNKYGSHYKFGPGLGHVFLDGSSLILYRDVEKTCKQIEKFSKKDARAYKDMIALFSNYVELLCTTWLYNPPLPQSYWSSMLEKTHDGREILRMMLSTPHHIVNQFFESENVKVWILLHVTQTGIPHDCYGNGFMFPLMFPVLHKSGIGTSVGGSIGLALAMASFIEAHQGKVLNYADVKEIVTKNGAAMGVKLSDGREFLSNKAIVCNVGPTILFGENGMVDRSRLNKDFLDQVDRWRPGDVALFTLHLALNERINYKASKREPDINRAYSVGMCESAEVLQKQFNSIRIGEIPRRYAIGFLAVMPTVIDPTQAPEGKHTAFIWQYAVNSKYLKGGEEKWDEIKREYEEECLTFWTKYTKNLKKPGVIIAAHSDTPLDIVRRNNSMIGGDFSGGDLNQDQLGIFRPFHGYPPYQTPVEHLWMCGPTTHPGGGCSAAPGYNCAVAIAEKLKIEKWWPTPPYFGGPPEEEM